MDWAWRRRSIFNHNSILWLHCVGCVILVSFFNATGCTGRSSVKELTLHEELDPIVASQDGQDIEHSFTITNPSAVKPLVIKKQSQSCACIEAFVDKWTLLPSESTEVRIKSHAPFATNVQRLALQLKTDSPDMPSVLCTLSAPVFARLETHPRDLTCTVSTPEAVGSLKFTVIVHGTAAELAGESLRIQSQSEHLRFEVGNSSLRPVAPAVYAREFHCTAHASTSAIQGSKMPTMSTARCPFLISYGQHSLHSFAEYKITPLIEAAPLALFMRSSPEWLSRTVTLKADESFRVLDVTSSVDIKSGVITDSERTKTHIATFQLKTPYVSDSAKHWVEVKTDHPYQKIVRIPLLILKQ